MDWKSHINLLIEAGATPDLIAQRIGVTANAVREIVAGRTKAPRADAAFKLAKLRPGQFSRMASRGKRPITPPPTDAGEAAA